MRNILFVCCVFYLLECTFCFSPEFPILRGFFGKRQDPTSDGTCAGNSKETVFKVIKSKILVKPAWIIDTFSFNEKVSTADDSRAFINPETDHEPPFSSGFVPLFRTIFRGSEAKEISLSDHPTELVDYDRPASTSTCTLSRYSRGFIPILRSWFR